ncbi:MAG: 16S rRNA (cytidine(1402)-2'-O)-methyltransferase [Terriglobus sp.]
MSSDVPLAPGLYLVATPIGNLEDITLRALRILRSADKIACEDTRHTQKLLNHFSITTPTVSYHLHNERGRSEELVNALREGARIAVVSDAGMPGIADPGEEIVRAAIATGIAVYPVPGANAVLSALTASGLPTERFAFHGFLPSKAGERRSALEALLESLKSAPETATHIFYETPHRIADSLADVEAVFGPGHPIALARELTKLHEEFVRGTASQVRANVAAREGIRGEMVLVISGTIQTEQAETPISLANQVRRLIGNGISEKDALKQVAKELGIGKSEAYREWQRTRTKR